MVSNEGFLSPDPSTRYLQFLPLPKNLTSDAVHNTDSQSCRMRSTLAKAKRKGIIDAVLVAAKHIFTTYVHANPTPHHPACVIHKICRDGGAGIATAGPRATTRSHAELVESIEVIEKKCACVYMCVCLPYPTYVSRIAVAPAAIRQGTFPHLSHHPTKLDFEGSEQYTTGPPSPSGSSNPSRDT